MATFFTGSLNASAAALPPLTAGWLVDTIAGSTVKTIIIETGTCHVALIDQHLDDKTTSMPDSATIKLHRYGSGIKRGTIIKKPDDPVDG